ncbi:unnamed protein product [Penicillium nalgiovense]|nr:unnamed protein product [Penicillium nalgiovense]
MRSEYLSKEEAKKKTKEEILRGEYNSSLILDDFQDDSPLSRGKTAAHLIFGPA